MSIILTVLLIIPIVFLLTAPVSLEPGFHTPIIAPFGLQTLSWVLVDFLFLCVAVYLHFKTLFRENSIMCGTLLVAFILSKIIYFSTIFLFN